MRFSVTDLADLIQGNQALVKKVQDAMNAGSTALDAMTAELARRQAQTTATVTPDATGRITVGRATTMKDEQSRILARIAALQRQINDLSAIPALLAALQADLSQAYVDLADTYAEAVDAIVPLSKADAAKIVSLIHEAELDTEQRKHWAAILHGAVSLVEAGLKVALAVAAS